LINCKIISKAKTNTYTTIFNSKVQCFILFKLSAWSILPTKIFCAKTAHLLKTHLHPSHTFFSIIRERISLVVPFLILLKKKYLWISGYQMPAAKEV